MPEVRDFLGFAISLWKRETIPGGFVLKKSGQDSDSCHQNDNRNRVNAGHSERV